MRPLFAATRRMRRDDEEGATLAELAVALVVASVVVLVAYGVYAGASRGARLWSERRRFEATALALERRLAGDLRASVRAETTATGYRLVGEDTTLEYRFQGRRLRRGGRLVIDDTLIQITLVLRTDTTTLPARTEAHLRLVRRQDTLRARLVATSRVATPSWQRPSPPP